jgi:hypothetical protein
MKLLLPTISSLSPKCAILRSDCLPLEFAAVFCLFFEKLLLIERHSLPR